MTASAGAPPSPAQLALWNEEQAADAISNSGYLAVTLTGEVTPSELRAAALGVLRRHEPLRSVLRLTEDGTVRQFVLPAADAFVFGTFAAPCPEGAERRTIEEWVAEHERPRRWDLATEAPIRFALLTHDGARRSLVLAVHHAGFDGRSKFVVAQDFTEYLNRALAGVLADIAPLPSAEAPPASAEITAEATASWEAALPRLGEPLALPGTLTPVARRVDCTAPAELGREHVLRLRELARRHGTTTFTTLVAALALQLSAYGNRLIPLAVAADVSDEHSRAVAGVQINVVPTLLDMAPEHTGHELITAAAAAVDRLRRFRRVPFQDLTKGLTDRSARRVMTQLGVSFPRAPQGLRLDVPGLKAEWEFFSRNTSSTFERTLHLRAQWPDCRARLDYRTETTGPREGAAFTDHFRRAVEALADRPDARLRDFRLPAAPPARGTAAGAPGTVPPAPGTAPGALPGRTTGARLLDGDTVVGWVTPAGDPVLPPRVTPAPGVELTVRDADGRRLAAGVPGILVHAPAGPAAAASTTRTASTDRTARTDGAVGIGRITADGVVEYLGPRGRRWVRHLGLIDAPLVERVLGAHPGVLRATVEMLSTPRGPVAVARVHPAAPDGATGGLTTASVREFLRERLAGHDVPGRIEIISGPDGRDTTHR
ncbi:condensation domain-containing protein [Streptomyces sp. NPDC057638]|uniref:condensation domain-containing protein n=1 Tax=Streptomyces sp. NPDC057638 TaxID=3346190 RepID=UPI00367956A6